MAVFGHGGKQQQRRRITIAFRFHQRFVRFFKIAFVDEVFADIDMAEWIVHFGGLLVIRIGEFLVLNFSGSVEIGIAKIVKLLGRQLFSHFNTPLIA